MANVSSYEYLKKIMDRERATSMDGTILGASGGFAAVRIRGSSRVLRDVRVPSHIPYSLLIKDRACSVGLGAGVVFLLGVYPGTNDGARGYLQKTKALRVPGVTVVKEQPNARFKITITRPTGATNYNFYGNDDGTGNNAHLISSGSYGSATSIDVYSRYNENYMYFAAEATDSYGNQSPVSSWVTDATVPPTPSLFTVTVIGMKKVQVSVSATDLTRSNSVKSGFVYWQAAWAETSGGSYTEIETLSHAPIWTIDNPSSDVNNIWIKIRAVDATGATSAWSSAKRDTVAPARIPAGISVIVVDATHIRVAVNMATDTSADEIGFRRWVVYGCATVDGTYSVIARMTSPQMDIVHGIGADPFIKLAAEDWAGRIGTQSAAVQDTTAPDIPSGITVNALNNFKIQIVIDPETDTSGDHVGFRQWRIYSCDTEGGSYVSRAYTKNLITEIINPHLATTPNPYFKLRAYDWAGNYSGLTAAVRDTNTPAQPTGLTITTAIDHVIIKVDEGTDLSHVSPGFRYWKIMWSSSSGGTYYDTKISFDMTTGVAIIPAPRNVLRYYKVYAHDWAGNVSAASAVLSGGGRDPGHGIVEDRFSTYGVLEPNDPDGIGWTLITGMNSNEPTLSGGNVVTSGRITGDAARTLTSTAKTITKPFVYNMSAAAGWGDEDYIVCYAWSTDASKQLTLKFEVDVSNYYYYTWTLSVGANWCKAKKKNLSTTGSPTWTGITAVVLTSADPGSYILIDDVRLSNADTDDLSTINETGNKWEFSGGEWHILPGNQLREPSRPYMLAQYLTGGAATYYAYVARSDISYGTAAMGGYFWGANGTMALAFCMDLSSGLTCLAVEVVCGTSASYVRLVKYVNGSRTQLASKTLAAGTLTHSKVFQVGVDFRAMGTGVPGAIKVYFTTTTSNMFTATYHVLTYTDTSINRGGYAGVINRQCRVRIFDFRAGSPEHALTADEAFLAHSLGSTVSVPDDGWIGLASDRGRFVIEKAEEAPDTIKVQNAIFQPDALKMGDVSATSISDDETMEGNADDAVPTEKAVKAYVDGKASGLVTTAHTHNKLVASDESPDPALSVDADGNVGIGIAAGPGILLHLFKDGAGAGTTELRIEGDTAGDIARLWLRSGTSDFIISHDSVNNALIFYDEQTLNEVARFSTAGLKLFATGADINEFSTDTTMAGNSNDAVPTEKAVKAYVDGKASGLVTTAHTHAKLVASDGSPDPALSADASGNLTAVAALTVNAGNLIIGDHNLIGNYASSLLDDNALSFTPGKTVGVLIVYSRHTTYKASYAILTYRTVATVFTQLMVTGTNVEVTTGELTGTTGTDGKLTISTHTDGTHTDGKIYIENRLGATYYPGWICLGL